MPVLLFVAALVGLYFGSSPIEAVLAWLFVASRYVHAFIHLTSNHVQRRFFAYATGVIILALFWVELIVRLVAVAVGGTQ